MPVKTITDLRTALAAGPAAERFATGFVDAYFGQAAGVLPKTEIDLLVFKLLIEGGHIDPDGSIYAMARALNVTPSKAKSLLFQYQLRCVDPDTVEEKVLKVLSTTRFSVDDKRLSFGIESPLVRAAIDARLKESNVFADISASGEILRVPLSQFGEFISLLLPQDKANALAAALQQDGQLGNGSLASWLNDFAKDTVKDTAKDVAKGKFSDFLGWLKDFAPGDGLPDFLSGGDVLG